MVSLPAGRWFEINAQRCYRLMISRLPAKHSSRSSAGTTTSRLAGRKSNTNLGGYVPTSVMNRSVDQETDSGTLTWAMTAHLSALCLYLGLIFGNLLFPYLIWHLKKKQSAYVADHALAALNFQITVTIAALIGLLIALFFPAAWLVVIVVGTANIILIGKAADRAKSGRTGRYPFTYRWFR